VIPATTAAPDRLLTVAEIRQRFGLSKSTTYLYVRDNRFPAPVKIGTSSRWLESEVVAWLAERVRERDAKAAA